MFANKQIAQEKYVEYLNVISSSLPDVYLNSNENLFFSIQVAAYNNKNNSLEKVNNIVITKENDNVFRYRLGKFPTYDEALEFKRIILSVCNDAFIVPIKNGERIHIKDALDDTAI